MIIIAGYTLTDPDSRQTTVEAFGNMIQRARNHEGCLDFSISADAIDPARVNLFECWRDEQSWKSWRKVAKGPRVQPREIHVKLYRSDRAEDLA